MSLKVEWRHFSSGIVYDITDRINLADGAFSVTENAEELTVGSSTLTIDDPDGDFDIPGHSYIRITETECPDEHVIWAGFVTIRHIKRAPGFLTGPARIWVGNLDDVNTVIARRILSETNDADRPAETDVERIQWLFDEGFLGVLDTYFSHANPVDMDASNYLGVTVYDAVNDCMLQSGKNAFQQDISDGLGGYINFTWYDFANSTELEVDLQISNVISDITAEVGRPSPSGPAQTWYASLDSDLARDPTRIYWKIRGQYDGGTVTRTRPLTAVEFAARETTASWPLVKTATAANARADRQLEDISTEEDIITTTIEVHPDHVNDARAGRKIQARFSHLPGYEDWSWMRILNRTVTLITPLVYRITYTLSPDAPAAPALSCSTVSAGITALDSGLGGPTSGPYVQTPATPADTPSMILAAYMISEGTGFLVPGAPTPDAPFVLSDAYYDGSGVHSYAGLAFAPWTSGTPDDFRIPGSGGSGGDPNYELITFDFMTSASAPVHHGAQLGSGGSVVLNGTPTPGNIVISYCFAEDNFSAPATGFTTIGTPVHRTGGNLGLNGITMVISYRCVQAGDTDTYGIGYAGSFTHHTFMAEFELTP